MNAPSIADTRYESYEGLRAARRALTTAELREMRKRAQVVRAWEIAGCVLVVVLLVAALWAHR